MLTASKRVAPDASGAVTIDASSEHSGDESGALLVDDVRRKVRGYVIDSILLGTADRLDDGVSLLDAGILDSTGTMELIAYLEDEFGITVFDSDIVADNLDSIDRICAFVERARTAGR